MVSRSTSRRSLRTAFQLTGELHRRLDRHSATSDVPTIARTAWFGSGTCNFGYRWPGWSRRSLIGFHTPKTQIEIGGATHLTRDKKTEAKNFRLCAPSGME